MEKLNLIVNKYYRIIIITFIIIAIFVSIKNIYKKETQIIESPPSPTPVTLTASYNSITPGISTEKELSEVLGKPLKTIKNGDQTINSYKVNYDLRTHSVVVENGKVSFIKEIINYKDTKKDDFITGIYGIAPNTLYENSPNSVFNLHVYPSNGIAYLGHTDGTLLEIWYFPPTTIENFKTLYASDYVEQTPRRGQ